MPFGKTTIDLVKHNYLYYHYIKVVSLVCVLCTHVSLLYLVRWQTFWLQFLWYCGYGTNRVATHRLQPRFFFKLPHSVYLFRVWWWKQPRNLLVVKLFLAKWVAVMRLHGWLPRPRYIVESWTTYGATKESSSLYSGKEEMHSKSRSILAPVPETIIPQ